MEEAGRPVRARFAFAARAPDELTIESGDSLIAVRERPDGWLSVRRIRDGACGLVPACYTTDFGVPAKAKTAGEIPARQPERQATAAQQLQPQQQQPQQPYAYPSGQPTQPAASAGGGAGLAGMGVLAGLLPQVGGPARAAPAAPAAGGVAAGRAGAASVLQVRRAYAARSKDELSIAPGDSLHVLQRYQDGWVAVRRGVDGAVGMVPEVCTQPLG
jgi:hypothetical protein